MLNFIVHSKIALQLFMDDLKNLTPAYGEYRKIYILPRGGPCVWDTIEHVNQVCGSDPFHLRYNCLPGEVGASSPFPTQSRFRPSIGTARDGYKEFFFHIPAPAIIFSLHTLPLIKDDSRTQNRIQECLASWQVARGVCVTTGSMFYDW